MPLAQAVLRIYLIEAPPAALEQLRAALPGLVVTPLGLEVPLDQLGPEEVLACCLRFGVTAQATRIVGSSPAG